MKKTLFFILMTMVIIACTKKEEPKPEGGKDGLTLTKAQKRTMSFLQGTFVLEVEEKRFELTMNFTEPYKTPKIIPRIDYLDKTIPFFLAHGEYELIASDGTKYSYYFNLSELGKYFTTYYKEDEYTQEMRPNVHTMKILDNETFIIKEGRRRPYKYKRK